LGSLQDDELPRLRNLPKPLWRGSIDAGHLQTAARVDLSCLILQHQATALELNF
jgi:hypothetical protein